MSLSPPRRAVLVVLSVAIATHALVILSFPRLLMAIVLGRIEARAGTNHAYAAPRPDHTFRSVVRPSPDLLYSVCVIDLDAAGGSVEVDATMPGTYGSIALYDQNTNVIRVLRDRDFVGRHVRALLVDSRSTIRAAPGIDVIPLPSRRALLLQRVLVVDESSLADVERGRRSLACRPKNQARP